MSESDDADARPSAAERLAAVLRHVPLRVFVVDRDGTFTHVEGHSDEARWPHPGGLVGKNARELFRGFPQQLEQLERAFAGETITARVDVEGSVTESHLEPIRGADGQIRGVLGVAEFITKRVRAEESLAQVEAEMRAVTDLAPIIVWSAGLDGIIRLSRGRALEALGVAPDEHVGMRVTDVYPEGSRENEDFLRACAGESIRGVRPLGPLMLESDIRPMRDAAGNVVAVYGIALDVTARHRAEQEAAKLEAQLIQAQKLESLAMLAGGIAHDFNNLLTAIMGSASLALSGLPAASAARRDLDEIVVAARRAAGLTRQLLAYTGKGRFETTTIDLASHLRETAALLETTVPKKLQLRLAPELPAIEADVAQVQQVVTNLVINAAEAIGERPGTITVSAAEQELSQSDIEALLGPAAIAPGRYVRLGVSDDGAGMDEATRERIFDPFFSTKFTGRGLGLAAAQGIVRAHAGAIRVTSSLGEGSTFEVFFPASTAVPARSEEPLAPMTARGIALVIDDEPTIRRALERLLEHVGFETRSAVDGVDGLEKFEALAPEISVVFLDMTMPRMNGEETFRGLRRIRADVPVILMSGYDEAQATRRFREGELDAFLQKPFSSEELLEGLKKALGRPPGA